MDVDIPEMNRVLVVLVSKINQVVGKTIQINKGSSTQQQHLRSVVGTKRRKICSRHEARYLTNYEFYPEKIITNFYKPKHNVTILSHYGRLHCQGNRTVETSGQYVVTILSHYDLAYQMGW